MRKLVFVLVLFAAVRAFGQATPRTCATPSINTCAVLGCYTGDGTDDRTITTSLNNQKMIFVARKTTMITDVSYWRTDTMGGGDTSCAMFNVSPPQCKSDRIQDITDGSFQIGTSLNQFGVDYCYYVFNQNDHFDTFQYDGNGSSPRTIGTFSFDPEICVIQLASGNSAYSANNFFVRTQAMAATVSFPLAGNVVSTGETTLITNLTTAGFVVGAGANESGKTYRGWCWDQADGFGEVLSWIGNGSGLGGGCANAADIQAIPVSGSGTVGFVLFTGCTDEMCNGGSCTSHVTACGWRGINIGTAAPSPGTTGSDYYFQWELQPDGGEQIGNLQSNSFDAAGGPSAIGGGASLNDTGEAYYGFAIKCAALNIP